jgi:hypothetical protein
MPPLRLTRQRWQPTSSMLHTYLTFVTLSKGGPLLEQQHSSSMWLLQPLYNNHPPFFERSRYNERALDARHYTLAMIWSSTLALFQTPLLLIIRIHSARARNGLERYHKGSRNSRYCQTSWLNYIGPLDRQQTRTHHYS